MSLLLALSAAFFWGVGDFFLAACSKRFGAYSNFVITRIIGLLVLSPFLIFILPQTQFTIKLIVILVGLSFIFATSVLLFLRSLEGKQATLNGVIASSFSIVSILISVVFLGESINVRQLFPVGLVIAGIGITSLNLDRSSHLSFVSPTTKYAVATMLLWGVYFSLVAVPSRQVHWIWPTLFARFTGLLYFPYIFARKKVKLLVQGKTSWVLLIAAALLPTIGDFSYYAGVAVEKIAFFVPIASATPVVYVFLSRLVFRERISHVQKIGIVITLAGIILLGL